MVKVSLSKRQVECLLEVLAGKTRDDAAAKLGISRGTLNQHLKEVFQKLKVSSKDAAAKKLGLDN